jgi:hypothetical protein
LFPTLFTSFFSRCPCPAQITSPCQCISMGMQHMFLGRVCTQCAFKWNACRDDRVRSRKPLLTWQSSTALILNLAKERFGPCMIQLFLALDTASVLAASASVCLRISRAIYLCTMAVLQGLRPKFCSKGSCHDQKANQQAAAHQELLRSSFSALSSRSSLM